MKPKVSVILPNYNHAPYLQERIDSILAQTFTNFELIILDDCSTDRSLSVLEPYKKHPKVSQFIINKANSGSPFKQWVKGLLLAQGDYIWIAESDDFAEPDFLAQTIAVMEKDVSISLTYCDSRVVDANGEEKGYWSNDKNTYFNSKRWSYDYRNAGLDELLDFILYRTTINNASAVLFRKTALLEKDYATIVTTFKNVGDLFTYLFVAMQGDISYLASPLNNYRQHAANLTTKNRDAGLLHYERFVCFSEILLFLQEKNISKDSTARLRIACRFILNKNAFASVETGHYASLKQFFQALESTNVFPKGELQKIRTLFKAYASKNRLISGPAKKVLKKSTFLKPAIPFGK